MSKEVRNGDKIGPIERIKMKSNERIKVGPIERIKDVESLKI